MKKLIPVMILLILLSGCATMGQFLGEPEIKLKGMAIDSLDLEGITFRCDYVIKNPYPLGISVSQIATDIIYEESIFLELVTSEGLNLEASSYNDNSILFTIPYESIMKLAGDSRDKSSLPFTLDGEARFDLSAIPYLENSSVSVPFHMDFDVPVFKPEFRITGGQVILPSTKEVTEAFVQGGLNIFKAGIMAGKMILGEPVDADVLEEIDLDVTILFDLAMDNRGGADWLFDLDRCSVDTGIGSLLDMEIRSDTGEISSAGEKIKMAAVVNTLEWGAFIVGLAGGNLTGSALVVESSLSFPGLPYEMSLPLNVEKELSLGSFGFSSK
jgi:hypothetical protein